MLYEFPAHLEPEPDGSAVNLQFPDVTGARTWGDDECEALELAQDCLIAALGGYIKLQQAIPRPSPARGRPVIAVPPLVAAKLALYSAMREQGATVADLAARSSRSETAIRRLLDLDHRSHVDEVEAALRCLGKRLEVEVRDAA